jgi:hypothetical protein
MGFISPLSRSCLVCPFDGKFCWKLEGDKLIIASLTESKQEQVLTLSGTPPPSIRFLGTP